MTILNILIIFCISWLLIGFISFLVGQRLFFGKLMLADFLLAIAFSTVGPIWIFVMLKIRHDDQFNKLLDSLLKEKYES